MTAKLRFPGPLRGKTPSREGNESPPEEMPAKEAQPEWEDWTNGEGKKITAIFRKLEIGKVGFELKGGKKVEYPIEKAVRRKPTKDHAAGKSRPSPLTVKIPAIPSYPYRGLNTAQIKFTTEVSNYPEEGPGFQTPCIKNTRSFLVTFSSGSDRSILADYPQWKNPSERKFRRDPF